MGFIPEVEYHEFNAVNYSIQAEDENLKTKGRRRKAEDERQKTKT